MVTIERLKHLLDYNPETGEFICRVRRGPMSVGKVAGTTDDEGYVSICVDGERYAAARLAVFWMTGQWPSQDVDHKDRAPPNNRWSNLRVATTQQNLQNKAVQKNNQLGLKGVYRHTKNGAWTGKYRSRIKANGRHIHLGLFDCPAAAHVAYVIAADTYFGEFAQA